MPDLRALVLESAPTPSLDGAWREFLRRADFPAHYVAPEYFLEPTLRDRRPFAILALADESPVGVLTGVRDRGHLVCGLQSRPQLALDPHVDGESIVCVLAAALAKMDRAAKTVSVVSYQPLPALRQRGYREVAYHDGAGIVVLDLRRGADALFRDFSENRRSNIRKAIKAGVTVDQATTDADFDEYYPIYTDWCAMKAQPVMHYELFRETMRLRGNRRLFLARHDGRVLAGAVVRFQPGGLLEYAANASRISDRGLRPNDLLHWRIIEWAIAEGFPTYSLCAAHLFLRKFGGTILSTYQYRRDLTFGHRYDTRDRLRHLAASAWHSLPSRVRTRLRPVAPGA